MQRPADMHACEARAGANAAASHATTGTRARIWLLLGDKVGDNRQVECVADALGEPVEVRRLRFMPRWQKGKPLFMPSLFHVDREASDPLEPPWPEMVLTIGRRPAMAALWLRRQSGNRTRIVLFGRPKRCFSDFALIVSPVQYQLPDDARVLRLGLPLLGIDRSRVEAATEVWREPLADLPRPLTILLVGGPTKPYRMDAAVARDLMDRTVSTMAPGAGLYVSTSRRTPPDVVDALAAKLPQGARLHVYDGNGARNPYLGLLGHGDHFVVTGDSVSMLTEIARLGLPLEIYRLPEASRPRAMRPPAALRERIGASGRQLLRRWGLLGWPRDLGALHELLVAEGRARFLGDLPRHETRVLPEYEIERVARRISSLLSPLPAGSTADDRGLALDAGRGLVPRQISVPGRL